MCSTEKLRNMFEKCPIRVSVGELPSFITPYRFTNLNPFGMPKTEILRRLHGIRCNLYNFGVCQDRCIIGFVMKDGKRFLRIKTTKNDEEGLDFPSDFYLIKECHLCHNKISSESLLS